MCGVSFFFTREREREFHTTRKRTKRTKRNTGQLLKREICIENVSHCDSVKRSLLFRFCPYLIRNFFITSLHTYHTHYCEHAAHVDVSIITIALLILLRDSSRNCCCCGFHQSVERDFIIIIIIIIVQLLPSQQKQKSSVDCVFVVVSSSFKRRRVRRRGSRRSRHSAIRGQSFRRRDEERFQLRRVVRGKL